MQRSIRSSVQWTALRKLQKADDAVSLVFHGVAKPVFGFKQTPCMWLSEQHHCTYAFTVENLAVSMLPVADIFGDLRYQGFFA